MAKREITLPELFTDLDWMEVFGEGSGGNCDKETDVCPPGSDVDPTSPSLADVVEIIAAVNGANDEESWIGVFLLKDGRYCIAEGACDYTGWDCRACNHLQVSRTLEDAIQFGLTQSDRQRLEL